MKKDTLVLIGVCVICIAMLTAAVAALMSAPRMLPSVTYQSTAVMVAEEEKLNINTATAQQLEALPGIGPVLAANIIAYREQNGGFDSLEELLEVDGIGDAKLRAMEPYLKMIDDSN